MKIKMEITKDNWVEVFGRDLSEKQIDQLVETICPAWYDPDRFEDCPKSKGSFIYVKSIMDLPVLAVKYIDHQPKELYDKYMGEWLLFVEIPYELL